MPNIRPPEVIPNIGHPDWLGLQTWLKPPYYVSTDYIAVGAPEVLGPYTVADAQGFKVSCIPTTSSPSSILSVLIQWYQDEAATVLVSKAALPIAKTLGSCTYSGPSFGAYAVVTITMAVADYVQILLTGVNNPGDVTVYPNLSTQGWNIADALAPVDTPESAGIVSGAAGAWIQLAPPVNSTIIRGVLLMGNPIPTGTYILSMGASLNQAIAVGDAAATNALSLKVPGVGIGLPLGIPLYLLPSVAIAGISVTLLCTTL